MSILNSEFGGILIILIIFVILEFINIIFGLTKGRIFLPNRAGFRQPLINRNNEPGKFWLVFAGNVALLITLIYVLYVIGSV